MQTEMNTEMCEITFEELDAVAGGTVDIKIDWRPSADTANLSKALQTFWNAVSAEARADAVRKA